VADTKKLSEYKPGERGKILYLCDNDATLKLLEMGCAPGEEVVLEYVAPLGDPVVISVAGYLLSLRKEEAATIMME
jgi:ferrous iron transport protein A